MRYLSFGLIWSISFCLCVMAHLHLHHSWHFDLALFQASVPFAFGGFVGGALSLKLCDRRKAMPPVQFCKLFVALVVFTLLFTHLYLFVGHQRFFTETPFLTSPVSWLQESFVAFLASVILFVLTGLRPLLPWGIILAAAISYSFSRGRWPARR